MKTAMKVRLTQNQLINLIAEIGPSKFEGLTTPQKRLKIYRAAKKRGLAA